MAVDLETFAKPPHLEKGGHICVLVTVNELGPRVWLHAARIFWLAPVGLSPSFAGVVVEVPRLYSFRGSLLIGVDLDLPPDALVEISERFPPVDHLPAMPQLDWYCRKILLLELGKAFAMMSRLVTPLSSRTGMEPLRSRSRSSFLKASSNCSDEPSLSPRAPKKQ